MSPDEYCQQKAAASGSSFYYSFLFLPPARRRAITALYAFCREVDDVVDECSDPQLARTKLAWWRNEVANLFHPVPARLKFLTAGQGSYALEFSHYDPAPPQLQQKLAAAHRPVDTED